jgi:hypothetical protein
VILGFCATALVDSCSGDSISCHPLWGFAPQECTREVMILDRRRARDIGWRAPLGFWLSGWDTAGVRYLGGKILIRIRNGRRTLKRGRGVQRSPASRDSVMGRNAFRINSKGTPHFLFANHSPRTNSEHLRYDVTTRLFSFDWWGCGGVNQRARFAGVSGAATGRCSPHGQNPVRVFHRCARYRAQGGYLRGRPPSCELIRAAAILASDRDRPPFRPIARAAF